MYLDGGWKCICHQLNCVCYMNIISEAVNQPDLLEADAGISRNI
jgi:hypothetical protein